MSSAPYVDSMWATKKRQVPFIVGNVTIVWESSYGMTLRNPGQLKSDELRTFIDDAIERAFNDDLVRFTNDKAVRELLEKAHVYSETEQEEGGEQPDVEMNVTMDGTDSTPTVNSVKIAGDKEIVHMSVDDLVKKGFLTKGVKGGGNPDS